MGPYMCVLGRSIGNLFKGICIKYKNKHGIGVQCCMPLVVMHFYFLQIQFKEKTSSCSKCVFDHSSEFA